MLEDRSGCSEIGRLVWGKAGCWSAWLGAGGQDWILGTGSLWHHGRAFIGVC